MSAYTMAFNSPLTYPGIKTATKLLGIHLIPIQTKNYEMTEDVIKSAGMILHNSHTCI